MKSKLIGYIYAYEPHMDWVSFLIFWEYFVLRLDRRILPSTQIVLSSLLSVCSAAKHVCFLFTINLYVIHFLLYNEKVEQDVIDISSDDEEKPCYDNHVDVEAVEKIDVVSNDKAKASCDSCLNHIDFNPLLTLYFFHRSPEM
jgi:hypothetical protein